MKLLKEFKIPFMMKKNSIMTINSWATQHWSTKSRLKNEYKDLLKCWFIDDDLLPRDLHFEWFPTYRDKRKRDAINVAPSIKVFEDCLVENGNLFDDDNTSHYIYPRAFDKSLQSHMLGIKIYKRD